MAFNFILLGLVILCVLHGMLAGLLRSLLLVAAVVLAYFASDMLGGHLGNGIAHVWGWPLSLSYVVGRLFAGFMIAVSLVIAAVQANTLWGKTSSGVTRNWNAVLGGIGGLIVGVVIAFALSCVVEITAHSLGDESPQWLAKAADSTAVKLSSGLNPAKPQTITDALLLLETLRKNPRLFNELSQDPQVNELLSLPVVLDVRNDEQIRELVQNRRWLELISHPKIKKMADDPEVKKVIFESSVLPMLKRKIAEIRTADFVRLLLTAGEDEKVMESLKKDKAIAEMLQNERLMTVLAEYTLCEGISEQDYEAVFSHDLFKALCRDRDIVKAVSNRELSDKIEAAIAKHRDARKEKDRKKKTKKRPGASGN